MREATFMRCVLIILATLLAPISTASAQSGTRVLFVPGGSLPRHMHGPVRSLLASRAALVSTDAYRRAADARNMRASSPRAVERIGTQQGADVIVVVTLGGHFRRRVLRARFFNGQSGELVTSGTYRTRGRRLRPASQHALLRDLAQSAGATGPAGPAAAQRLTEPPPVEVRVEEERPMEEPVEAPPPWEPPPEDTPEPEPLTEADDAENEAAPEEGSEEGAPGWGFALEAGIGAGNRSNTIPFDGAEASLSSTAYPTAEVGALGYVLPDPGSRFRVELSARYVGSIGLRVDDRATDGSELTSDLNAHHVAFGVMARLPLAPGERMTELLFGVGGSFHVLQTHDDASIPSYAVGGVVARAGFYFYIGDSPISIGVVPEVGQAVSLTEELSEQAQLSDGFSVGAEAVVRVQIIDEVSLSFLYTESHTFLSSESGAEMHDVTRYGVLGVRYER